MKSYEDIAERVFRRGDEILKKRQRRTVIIKRTSLAVSGMCAAVLVCFGVWKNNDIKNAMSNLPDSSHIITENDTVPETTTEFLLQTSTTEYKNTGTSLSLTSTTLETAESTDVFASVTTSITTSATTSENNKLSGNTFTCTTVPKQIYSVNTTKAQTKLTDKITQIIVNTTEVKTETTHKITQTTVSTAVQTSLTETNTTFLTETTTTSENTDDERSIYMKKLTSFFTSAVVLAASATPVIGHAEYNVDPGRYWPGEKAMFAKMDSGELDTDIDGNGTVDALDGYLLECYCLNKNATADLGFNIPDDINSRIEVIADYNGDGEVNNADTTSWVRHFIINRNLKAELFNYDYYVSEYVSEDSEFISSAKGCFTSNLYSEMEHLLAGYDVVTDMYGNGTLNLDVNENGQLDIGDLYDLYVHRYDKCNDAFKTYYSTLSMSPQCSRDNFFYYVTLCIVENIELKPEYFTEEYYVETYGISDYRAGIISSRVEQAAAALGLKVDKDAWLKFNHDDLYSFFDSYCNDVESGLRSVPDVNMDGVVDYNDYFASNIYFGDLLNDRTADESILPADIWNNLAENCDFNGNGTSKDIYDILAIQLYVVKYAESIDNFQEAYDEYIASLGGTYEISIEGFSYENNVKILSAFEDNNIVYGDANCDGKVTIADATAIVQFLGNPDEFPLSEQGKKNADCYNTGDGITGKDATAIKELEAGHITSLSEIQSEIE